jgi:hypothetical protein
MVLESLVTELFDRYEDRQNRILEFQILVEEKAEMLTDNKLDKFITFFERLN